jgi:hypothetical protein
VDLSNYHQCKLVYFSSKCANALKNIYPALNPQASGSSSLAADDISMHFHVNPLHYNKLDSECKQLAYIVGFFIETMAAIEFIRGSLNVCISIKEYFL